MGMWDLIHQWRSAGKAEHKAQGAQATKEFSDNVGAAHQVDEIAGLDFRKAIDLHLQWKERLRSVVEGNSSEQLDIRLVASDAQCVMGKWIHGNGGVSYGESGQFASLRAHHADFHGCAAGILTEARAGRMFEAKVRLGNSYAKASEAVKHDLSRLYLALSQRWRRLHEWGHPVVGLFRAARSLSGPLLVRPGPCAAFGRSCGGGVQRGAHCADSRTGGPPCRVK